MKRDDSTSRLIGNSFFLMADWVSATILSMIFWIVVGKTMDTSGYGIVSAAVNISLLIAAFTMVGMRDAATNLISRYMKTGRMANVVWVFRFSSKFILVGNAVSAAVIAAFSQQIAGILNLPVEAVWLVAVLNFAWGFWLLTTGFLQGMQNMKLLFKTNLIGQIVKVVIPIAFFFFSVGITSPIIAYIVSMLLTVALRIRHFPGGRSAKMDGRDVVTRLAVPVFISSVMWLVFTNMPNVILNAIKSPDVTGIFALSLTLVTPIVFIPMTLNQALFPITSGLTAASRSLRRQSQLISTVLKLAAFITLPLIALLLVFSRQIILFFSQPQYLPTADLLPIVAPAAILLGIGQILVSNIFAVGKPNVTRNITVAVTLIFLAASIYGTYAFSYFGMAWAYLISMAVLVVSSYAYLRRHVKLDVDWAAMLKIFIATLVMAAFANPLNSLASSVPLKVLVILAAAGVYFAMLVPLRYYSMDEVKIVRYLSSRSKLVGDRLKPIEEFLLRRI